MAPPYGDRRRSAGTCARRWRSGRPARVPSVERFLVTGGARLAGTVQVAGAKNSVLKLMAAALLAEGTTVISNCPEILDVPLMADVLRGLGCRGRSWTATRSTITTPGRAVVPCGFPGGRPAAGVGLRAGAADGAVPPGPGGAARAATPSGPGRWTCTSPGCGRWARR